MLSVLNLELCNEILIPVGNKILRFSFSHLYYQYWGTNRWSCQFPLNQST